MRAVVVGLGLLLAGGAIAMVALRAEENPLDKVDPRGRGESETGSSLKMHAVGFDPTVARGTQQVLTIELRNKGDEARPFTVAIAPPPMVGLAPSKWTGTVGPRSTATYDMEFTAQNAGCGTFVLDGGSYDLVVPLCVAAATSPLLDRISFWTTYPGFYGPEDVRQGSIVEMRLLASSAAPESVRLRLEWSDGLTPRYDGSGLNATQSREISLTTTPEGSSTEPVKFEVLRPGTHRITITVGAGSQSAVFFHDIVAK